MLGMGVHPKVVSDMLGHASIGITLDTYSHVAPGMHREAAGAIGLLLADDGLTPDGSGREADD
jgi:integrase